MPVLRAIQSTATATLDELFPTHRDLGTRDDWRADAPKAYCARCGATCGPGASSTSGCANCLNTRPPWKRVVRLGSYAPPLRDWIVGMKFGRAWSWGPWLGEQLAAAVGDEKSERPVAVCFVPMHFVRKVRRGYNQAQLIAQGFAKTRGWPVADVLRRTRWRAPQTTVPPSERDRNVRDSFGIRTVSLAGWDVWLIDDVKTTGSTLTACARLLRRAGANEVNIAVAAVADHK